MRVSYSLSILSFIYYCTIFKVLSQDNIFTITPNYSACIGESVIITCYLFPPTANGYSVFARLSFNGSTPEDVNDINNDFGSIGYIATVVIPVMGDSARIQLTITSLQVSDSNTIFGCHAQLNSDGSVTGAIEYGTASLSAPPSPPVSLTADYNSPTCSGTVQLAWTPGANDRDIEMYFLSLNGVLIAGLGPDTSYTHTTTLQRDIEYTYSVIATSCAGDSTETNATSIFVGDPPSSPLVTLSQTDTRCSNTLISWSTPSSDRAILTYSVYRDDTFLTTTTDNQYTDNAQLNIDTVYEYSVVAISCAGNSTAGVMSISIGSYTITYLTISYDNTTNEVYIDWTLNFDQPPVPIFISYSIMLLYSYTQNNITYHYATTNTFSQISNDTTFIQTIREQAFYSNELVQTAITALLTIAHLCNTSLSGVGLSAVYSSEYTPVQTTTTTTQPVTVVIVIILIMIILTILLVSIVVISVMGIALGVMYRKINQQQTITTTPAVATHPYEYIDVDMLAEHMSPARTADDTDYIHMTNPQYSNLK